MQLRQNFLKAQAKDARHHILDIMEDTISEPADSLSGNAPRLESIELPKDKIGEVIGPNGNYKNIPELSKWILSVGMLLGRLELFAVLVLFFPSFWRN